MFLIYAEDAIIDSINLKLILETSKIVSTVSLIQLNLTTYFKNKLYFTEATNLKT